MLRVLALVLIYQRLKIPNFDFNVPTSFNIHNFKIKACFIPQQLKEKSLWRDSYGGNRSE